MVSRSYELAEPAPPSSLHRWFDQQVIPAAIDAVAAVEVVLDTVAERTERSPLPSVGFALVGGAMLALLMPRAGYRRLLRR